MWGGGMSYAPQNLLSVSIPLQIIIEAESYIYAACFLFLSLLKIYLQWSSLCHNLNNIDHDYPWSQDGADTGQWYNIELLELCASWGGWSGAGRVRRFSIFFKVFMAFSPNAPMPTRFILVFWNLLTLGVGLGLQSAHQGLNRYLTFMSYCPQTRL